MGKSLHERRRGMFLGPKFGLSGGSDLASEFALSGATALNSGVGGSLAQLFAHGEDGFLFGPFTDLTRLFLLSTGATGNVAVDTDPVGLNLDRHSWNGNTLAQVLAAAPELESNGGFDTDTVWSKGANWTISGGVATKTGGAANDLTDNAVVPVVGRTYAVTFTVSGYGGSGSVTASMGANGTARTANGTYTEYLTAIGATALKFIGGTSFAGSVDNVSVKLVPGNHALQATLTKRPVYKTNSGKPYLQSDGTDDGLFSPFLPQAAMTLACAFSSATASGVLVGGGNSGTNQRCSLSLDASGRLSAGWGTQTLATIFAGSDIRNANHVGILSADATTVDLWLDGVKIYSAAASGSPSGVATGPIGFGANNNNGTPGSFSNAGIFAALVRNVKSTDAEIANINSKFQGAYQ